MDLQPPPKNETEILVSITNQELEKFDSELAALCNGIKAKKQTPSPTSQISNDFDESAAEFRALLAEGDRILPAFEKNVDNVVQLELRISALEKSTTHFDSQQKKSAAEQENLKQQLQLCRQDMDMFRKEAQQVNDNQATLNTQYLELKAKIKALKDTLPTNLHALILNAKAYQKDIETLSRNNEVLSSAYIDQFNKNVNLEQKLETLEQEIKQNHDNDVELNKRYLELSTSIEASDQAYPRDIKFLRARIDLLENKQATSLSQFRCLAAGVIGFIAGFLIWFYAHKAELLR